MTAAVRLTCGLAALLALATTALADHDAAGGQAHHIVSLGGSVTEIAVALGAEDRLIARDTTSNHPPSILALPDVGYIRALSPESVLSLNPDLIIAEGDAGPPEAVEVLKSAGIPFVIMPKIATPEGLIAKITAVAEALGRPEEGAALAATTRAGLDEARARAEAVPQKKKVLFILSLTGGRIMAAGTGTEAEGIIALSGGESVGTGFAGYKQMTDEAVLAAQPDVILMMEREGDLAVLDADLFSHPAIAETPAGKARAVIRMDGMLMLGFGPRTPQAAAELHDLLYPASGG